MNISRLTGLMLLAAATPVAAQAPSTALHFAGYADVTWARTPDGKSAATVTFAPILNIAVGERLFIEVELEGEADSGGHHETGVEYVTASWLLGDHAALVVGKFLSPAGYFFQNQHPSWINRLPSAPPGFGHGGAAPLSDVGVQLRGGAAFARQSINYAVYAANGPRMGLDEMGLEDADQGAMGVVDLELDGSTHNRDGRRVVGGRFGWLPIPTLEVGASLVRGGVRLLDNDPGMTEPSRSYSIDGMDAAWRPIPRLDLRAEWLRQRVGAAEISMVPEALAWRTWYVQSAWRFAGGRWEAVLRQGDSTSPHAEATFQQTAIGLNWLLHPRSQMKAAWEFNRSDDEHATADRLLLQWAYAF